MKYLSCFFIALMYFLSAILFIAAYDLTDGGYEGLMFSSIGLIFYQVLYNTHRAKHVSAGDAFLLANLFNMISTSNLEDPTERAKATREIEADSGIEDFHSNERILYSYTTSICNHLARALCVLLIATSVLY